MPANRRRKRVRGRAKCLADIQFKFQSLDKKMFSERGKNFKLSQTIPRVSVFFKQYFIYRLLYLRINKFNFFLLSLLATVSPFRMKIKLPVQIFYLYSKYIYIIRSAWLRNMHIYIYSYDRINEKSHNKWWWCSATKRRPLSLFGKQWEQHIFVGFCFRNS